MDYLIAWLFRQVEAKYATCHHFYFENICPVIIIENMTTYVYHIDAMASTEVVNFSPAKFCKWHKMLALWNFSLYVLMGTFTTNLREVAVSLHYRWLWLHTLNFSWLSYSAGVYSYMYIIIVKDFRIIMFRYQWILASLWAVNEMWLRRCFRG